MKLMYFRRFRLNRMMITWIGGTKRLHTYRCCWPLGGEREDWWREREKERKKNKTCVQRQLRTKIGLLHRHPLRLGAWRPTFEPIFSYFETRRGRARRRERGSLAVILKHQFFCVLYFVCHIVVTLYTTKTNPKRKRKHLRKCDKLGELFLYIVCDKCRCKEAVRFEICSRFYASLLENLCTQSLGLTVGIFPLNS